MTQTTADVCRQRCRVWFPLRNQSVHRTIPVLFSKNSGSHRKRVRHSEIRQLERRTEKTLYAKRTHAPSWSWRLSVYHIRRTYSPLTSKHQLAQSWSVLTSWGSEASHASLIGESVFLSAPEWNFRSTSDVGGQVLVWVVDELGESATRHAEGSLSGLWVQEVDSHLVWDLNECCGSWTRNRNDLPCLESAGLGFGEGRLCCYGKHQILQNVVYWNWSD